MYTRAYDVGIEDDFGVSGATHGVNAACRHGLLAEYMMDECNIRSWIQALIYLGVWRSMNVVMCREVGDVCGGALRSSRRCRT